MKRGPGPARKTPLTAKQGLKATKGLTTHTELSPGGGPTRKSPPPGGVHDAPRRSTPQQRARAVQRSTWEGLRVLTLGRDGYRCAWCGRYDLALEVHHRALKGLGGSRTLDHPANLISLCGWGNHTGCHGRAHSDRVAAEDAGMTVARGTDPATIPVRYLDGLWLLDDDGERRAVGAGTAPRPGSLGGDNSPGSWPAW